MSADDGIRRLLPEPPPPAPARRAAAMDAALRMFDGADAVAGTVALPQPTATAPWWRQHAGAVASLLLVTAIGLPVTWMSMGDPPSVNIQSEADAGSGRAERRQAPLPAPDRKSVDPSIVAPDQALAEQRPLAAGDARTSGGATAEASNAEPADQEYAPAALPPPAPPADFAQGAPAAGDASGRSGLVAVAPAPLLPPPIRTEDRLQARAAAPARMRAPSANAAVAQGGDDIVVTGSRVSRAAEKAAGAGPWNACTVDDPRRRLSDCRTTIDPGAKGATGQAASQVAAGLTMAWQGDMDGAIRAFDGAIAIAPRSSNAYLNRGIAHRRNGDVDRAIADLDKAVRFAPNSAPAFYQRSFALREKGETRRADADLQRAIDIDGRYRDLTD